MKIGIICPVGPLDRFGYQYNNIPVLQSHSAFADRIYLCSTTANRRNVDSLLGRFPNVTYVWEERFTFDIDDAGNEIFDLAKIVTAVNAGLERSRRDGMDVALNIHINQYIQADTIRYLKAFCRKALDRGLPFGWLYKKHQIGDKLFHSDTRLPWVVNLRLDDRYVFGPDQLECRDGSELYRIQHADFRFMDHLAVVDCAMELTPQDLADKTTFIRGYEGLTGVAWEGFDEEAYHQYYAKKFSAKVLSRNRLDATGRAIASASREDFVGWEILRRYQMPGIKSRLVEYLHGQYLVRFK